MEKDTQQFQMLQNRTSKLKKHHFFVFLKIFLDLMKLNLHCMPFSHFLSLFPLLARSLLKKAKYLDAVLSLLMTWLGTTLVYKMILYHDSWHIKIEISWRKEREKKKRALSDSNLRASNQPPLLIMNCSYNKWGII